MISKDDLESFGYYDGYWREELDEKGNLSVSQMVEEYQKVAGQEPDPSLYAGLIVEEFAEWFAEVDWVSISPNVGEYSPTSELKELSDLVYVIYGYAKARGWNLEEAVCRVHNNNMQRMFQEEICSCCQGSGLSRIGLVEGMSSYCISCSGTGNHCYIKRREDGKIIRNPNVPKPNLNDLV